MSCPFKAIAAMSLVLVVTPAPALAQDFVITVPVQATKLPSYIKTFSIECDVQYDGTQGAGYEPIGKGTLMGQPIPPGGTFVGDVRVPVTAFPNKDRAKATSYACGMWFSGIDPVTGKAQDYFASYTPGQRQATFPVAAGAPFVRNVRGSIQP